MPRVLGGSQGAGVFLWARYPCRALYVLFKLHLGTFGGVSSRSFAAIRKEPGLYCGSRLRKGEVFAYVGLSQNLKDLKETGLTQAERDGGRGGCDDRCGANPAQMRQSRPDSCLDFQVHVRKTFEIVLSSLDSGRHALFLTQARRAGETVWGL